jgi:hypothetical protein
MATPNLDLEKIELTDNMQTSLLQKMNGNFKKIDSAYEILKNTLLDKTGKNTLTEAIEYVGQLVNAQDGTITPDKVFNGYVGYSQQDKIVGTALAEETVGEASQLLTGAKLYANNGELINGTMIDKSNTISEAIGSLDGDNYVLAIPQSGYYDENSLLKTSKEKVISTLGVKVIPNITLVLTGNNTTYINGYGAGIDKNGKLVIWAMSNSSAYEHISFNAVSFGSGNTGSGWGITSFDTGDPTGVPYACIIENVGNYNNINITLNASSVNSSYDYVTIGVTTTVS